MRLSGIYFGLYVGHEAAQVRIGVCVCKNSRLRRAIDTWYRLEIWKLWPHVDLRLKWDGRGCWHDRGHLLDCLAWPVLDGILIKTGQLNKMVRKQYQWSWLVLFDRLQDCASRWICDALENQVLHDSVFFPNWNLFRYLDTWITVHRLRAAQTAKENPEILLHWRVVTTLLFFGIHSSSVPKLKFLKKGSMLDQNLEYHLTSSTKTCDYARFPWESPLYQRRKWLVLAHAYELEICR